MYLKLWQICGGTPWFDKKHPSSENICNSNYDNKPLLCAIVGEFILIFIIGKIKTTSRASLRFSTAIIQQKVCTCVVAWHSVDTISGFTVMDTHSEGPDVSGSVPWMLGTLVGGGGDKETGPRFKEFCYCFSLSVLAEDW